MVAFPGKPGSRRRGFTLIELLMTIVLLGVLAAVAVPGFDAMLLNNRLAAQSNLFLSSLQFARSEAIKRGARVVVCKSANGTTCVTTGGWQQGWIVFLDENNNGTRENTETLFRVDAALTNGFSLTGGASVVNLISFDGSGAAPALAGAANEAARTLTLCRASPANLQRWRQITITPTGRPTIETGAAALSSCPP